MSSNANDFLKKFYDNQVTLVSDQIRHQYQTNPTNSINNVYNDTILNNSEFGNLNATIESLTIHMKDVLNNEGNLYVTPLVGQSDSNENEKPLSKAEKSYINHGLRSTLVDTQAENVNIICPNTKDPLYSAKSFQDLKLKPELLKGISSMGFRKPSAIQEKALPMLLELKPRNLIAQSQSGTGKTATFLLTMLSKININEKCCQCLCMAPTRELATQIAEVAQTMSKFMNNVKITCAVKGQYPEMVDGEVASQIVIGTPGTLKFWTTESSSIYLNPKLLKVFVLDEADVLIENSEFLNIAKRIKSKVTNDCQILLFSATYDERVIEFAHEFVPNPTEFTIKPQELTLKNINQYYIQMKDIEEKYPTLIEIYGQKSMGQCIIFCESRQMAFFLKTTLEKDSHLSSLLTGELDFQKREEEIKNFRSGKSRVLIATNLCSRGIDIPQVNLIINWDMPKTREGNPDCETYLHRIGRSGRFGKRGLTINFIATDSDLLIQNKIIEAYGAHIEEMKDLGLISSL